MSQFLSTDKQALQRLIVTRLTADLDVAQRAAQTAYETATHEENVAENKYDTLGLEASYLATGQARRTDEIREALQLYHRLPLPDFGATTGIVTGALITLEAENGDLQHVFLGPDAAGLKIDLHGQVVTIITTRSPLGQALLGKLTDEEVCVTVGKMLRCRVIVHIV